MANQSIDDSKRDSKKELSANANINALIEKVSRFQDDRFIYLNYAFPPSSESFSPYNLKEVTYQVIDKAQFYTMSRYGVTYWGRREKYFTELLTWQNEYNLYCRLISVSIAKENENVSVLSL